MGGSSKSVTVGHKYYVGMHMALCHGPVDKLVRIRVGGNTAWVGNHTGGSLTINKPDLFGGEKREGGVSGQIDIEMGAPTQGQNSYLAAKLGADLLPAFRGVCCAVLRQVYVGLNPYLKDWAWLLQRVNVKTNGEPQWYSYRAMIGPKDPLVVPAAFSEPSAGSIGFVFDPLGVPGCILFEGINSVYNPSNQANINTTCYKFFSQDIFIEKITFNVRVEEANHGDGMRLAFINSNGTVVFQFFPRVSAYQDSLQRAAINSQANPVTAAALSPLMTYTVTMEFDAGGCDVKINMGVGESEVTRLDNLTAQYIKGVKFMRDGDFVGSDTPSSIRYSGITVQGYVVEPGYPSQEGYYTDMNPAHIIRECLTDTTWGMGYPESDIDDAAFTAAADQLYVEGMGMSILWSQQTSIEDFVGEVLRHIDAALYVDRTTGQFVLKLIRGGYDPATLLVLDKSNISRVEGYTKQTLAELINEITVTYDSNETGQTETVTYQNLAMIQQQGAIIPATVDYPGFANQDVASRAAARDLKAMSAHLVSATIYANREAAILNIGNVFRWDWIETDEDGNGVTTAYVMRVTEIAFGDGVDNTVRIQCVQDVFSFPDTTYVEAEPTGWENPSAPPQVASPRLAIEAPYYELVRQLGEIDATNKLATLPELGLLMVASGRQGLEINADIQIDSGAGYASGGTLDFCPAAKLDGSMGILDTTATLKDGVDLDEFVAGSLAQINAEIVVIESITDNVATIKRGCLDTIPAAHADSSAVIIWDGYAASDGVEYVASDALDVKILPVTGGGVLALDAAPVDSVTMNHRAVRPYPPADVKIGGVYFPGTVAADDLVGIVATWVHRDRIQQTGGSVLGWTEGGVGPEAGVTYSARLVRADTEAELDSSTGISGNTVTFTPSYRGSVRLEIWAVRDGLASFHVFAHTFFYLAFAPLYHESAPVYCDGEEVYYGL